MEAQTTLEEKLSTKAALIVLGCATFAVTEIGVLVLLKKVRWKRMRSQKQPAKGEFCLGWAKRNHGWAEIRDTLMSSLRWSGPSKWPEQHTRRGLDGRPIQLDELEGYRAEIIGRRSHNSESQVWQRPILTGEKCELPRFSRLILYDRQGRPLRDPYRGTTHQQQVRTLLKAQKFVIRSSFCNRNCSQVHSSNYNRNKYMQQLILYQGKPPNNQNQ